MRRLLTPFARLETYRALLYSLAGLALASLGLAVLVAGWTLTLSLGLHAAGLLLVVRASLGGRSARSGAGGSRQRTARHPGEPADPHHERRELLESRTLNVLRDPAFWKQQLHLAVTWPLALIPLTFVCGSLALIALPVWYRWSDSSDAPGLFQIDSFVEALPFAAAGCVLLAVSVNLLGPYTSLSRRLATRLLAGDAGTVRTPADVRVRHPRALTINALTATSIVVAALVVIWALTSGGYFWPVWPLLSLALVVGIAGWVVLVLERPEITRLTLGSQALAIQIGVSVVLFGFLVAVWAVASNGYFWPMWAGLGLALLAAVHAAVVYGRRVHRIEELEESRAGAVDLQETELRRIERDLHDGAQARLVALGMSIGMAEEKLQTDPEGARLLLAEARTGAREALEELRDLARGIHPPILTDRGLEAAIAALAARSPLPVSVSVDVPERPAGAVETATYFVVAEALANAIKYAGASGIDISVRRSKGLLVAEIVDDGRGGADPSGGGLTGLKRRVGALDGTLRVASPAGGPTSVRMELPCA